MSTGFLVWSFLSTNLRQVAPYLTYYTQRGICIWRLRGQLGWVGILLFLGRLLVWSSLALVASRFLLVRALLSLRTAVYPLPHIPMYHLSIRYHAPANCFALPDYWCASGANHRRRPGKTFSIGAPLVTSRHLNKSIHERTQWFPSGLPWAVKLNPLRISDRP
jgi:hypothetical protein